jgi:magnesium transporter
LLAKKRYPSSYVYVVDKESRLVGVLNLRDLMLAAPDQMLDEISRKDYFALHCFTDQQDAANELAKRIILTTLTDVVGFIAFLGFAVLFQKLSV